MPILQHFEGLGQIPRTANITATLCLEFDAVSFEQVEDAFNEMYVCVGDFAARMAESELHELYYQLGVHLTNINLVSRLGEGPYAHTSPDQPSLFSA